jgi:hypothetical protein
VAGIVSRAGAGSVFLSDGASSGGVQKLTISDPRLTDARFVVTLLMLVSHLRRFWFPPHAAHFVYVANALSLKLETSARYRLVSERDSRCLWITLER